MIMKTNKKFNNNIKLYDSTKSLNKLVVKWKKNVFYILKTQILNIEFNQLV